MADIPTNYIAVPKHEFDNLEQSLRRLYSFVSQFPDNYTQKGLAFTQLVENVRNDFADLQLHRQRDNPAIVIHFDK